MTNETDREPSDREAEDAAWDAEMTAKDPLFPARKAASLALDKYVREWIDGYELDDGEVNHAPTELESFLIHDAFAGLSEDEEYLRLRAAWKALCGPAERLACQSAAAPPIAPHAYELQWAAAGDDCTTTKFVCVLPHDLDGYEKITPLYAAPPSAVLLEVLEALTGKDIEAIEATAREYESLGQRWREASAYSQEVANLHATYKAREHSLGKLAEGGLFRRLATAIAKLRTWMGEKG